MNETTEVDFHAKSVDRLANQQRCPCISHL